MVGVSYETSGCSLNIPSNLLPWCDLVVKYAEKYNLDPYLVFAVMQQESGGQLDVVSISGAIGLMQVMPNDGIASTFMCKNGPCFADRPSIQELMDPEFNVNFGTKTLADFIGIYGSIREALKAYGPKDVGYYYADIVLGIYNQMVYSP